MEHRSGPVGTPEVLVRRALEVDLCIRCTATRLPEQFESRPIGLELSRGTQSARTEQQQSEPLAIRLKLLRRREDNDFATKLCTVSLRTMDDGAKVAHFAVDAARVARVMGQTARLTLGKRDADIGLTVEACCTEADVGDREGPRRVGDADQAAGTRAVPVPRDRTPSSHSDAGSSPRLSSSKRASEQTQMYRMSEDLPRVSSSADSCRKAHSTRASLSSTASRVWAHAEALSEVDRTAAEVAEAKDELLGMLRSYFQVAPADVEAQHRAPRKAGDAESDTTTEDMSLRDVVHRLRAELARKAARERRALQTSSSLPEDGGGRMSMLADENVRLSVDLVNTKMRLAEALTELDAAGIRTGGAGRAAARRRSSSTSLIVRWLRMLRRSVTTPR